jgi:hypothetical protein
MHELFVLESDESLDVSLAWLLFDGLLLHGLLFDGLQNGEWRLQGSIEGIIDGGLGVAEGSCFRDEEEVGKIGGLVDGNECLFGTLE